MAKLFSPISLGGVTLPNRLVVSPMCQYSADDGSMTDWHLIHLGQLALSGAGLVVVEATGVTREGRITHGCTGLYSDDNEAAMARVIQACRRLTQHPLGIQLATIVSLRNGNPWDVTAGVDLDRDGNNQDRPAGLQKNSGGTESETNLAMTGWVGSPVASPITYPPRPGVVPPGSPASNLRSTWSTRARSTPATPARSPGGSRSQSTTAEASSATSRRASPSSDQREASLTRSP